MTLLAVLIFAAAVLPARQLPVQVYTSAHGLPRNTVNCLVPGSTGLLWVCTSEGLARFDGRGFQVFGTAHGLPSRVILGFVPSRRGGYWVVTDLGVCRLLPAARIGEPCKLLDVDRPAGEFTGESLIESEHGDTWVATTTALYRLSPDGRRLEREDFQAPAGEVILTLAEGSSGALLIGTVGGLYEYRRGVGARKLSQAVGPMGPRQILRLPSGEMLVGSSAGLFRLLPDSSLRRVPLPGMTWAYGLVRRHDGSIWVGGVGGLTRLVADAKGELQPAEHYKEEDGLPSAEITAIAEDAQGNIWGATEGVGIFRLEDSGFVTWSEKDGLGEGRVWSIFEDHSGRVCVQMLPATLLVKNGDHFDAAPIRHPASVTWFGWGWNQLAVPARHGEWWVPSAFGLLHFPKLARTEDLSRAEPRVYGANSPLGCSMVFRTFEDSAGDLWTSCLEPKIQFTRWERSSGTFHHWSAAEGWPEGATAVVIRESASGARWIGTSDSAVRFRNGKFETFDLAPGRRQAGVRDLLVDHAGRVWVATRRAGVFRCDNPDDPRPVFRAYTVSEGLSTDAVDSLIEDRAGFVYAGTARGIDRIDPAAPIGSRRIRHLAAADRLPSSEQVTAFRDSRGHLWFGSMRGLAEFDPSAPASQWPPNVYVMRVRVRGEDVPLPWEGTRSVSLDLAADRNQVEIEYAGLDLRSAESLRYQYRLTGLDKEWSGLAGQLSVNYASLPRGRFRFEVRAVDADGRVSEPAGIDGFVQAPIWRRWWFLGGVAGLVAAVAVALYNYRVSHLLALERLRTRIATDLHDDIGASLTQISILSEVAKRSPAPQALSDIAELARAMASDMSDIVWAISPRHDRFDGLVHRMRRFAGDTLGGPNIELTFEADRLRGDLAVPLEARRPLYLVFKEAVNNVARHSGATRASIRIGQDHRSLRLVVEDDGRGFDSGRSYDGEGLASMARRMKDLGGSAAWDSKPGQGSRFTAVLPLRERRRLPKLMGRLWGAR